MCGIVGFINFSGKAIDKKSFEKMVDILRHRGPDDKGMKFFPGTPYAALGHRRLAIIDLSYLGHQPMCNEDGNICIVYNGEIYNYKALKDDLVKKHHKFRSSSDSEVIVHLYEEYGLKFLKKLVGMFALAIWDSKIKKLMLARDRLGVKPLYYYTGNKFFIFASEIKAILAAPEVEANVDWRALHNPIHFQVPPRTGFKDIFKLPPGHVLIIEKNSIRLTKYWDIYPREDDIELKDAILQLRTLLENSVHLSMQADVPVGAFLSGGLDSSAVVALMSKYSSQSINTFTIKFTEHDIEAGSFLDDSVYAKKVAEVFGTKHQEIAIKPDIVDLLPKLIWYIEEPLADSAVINTYLISKIARDKGVKVLLTGMGGDEVFGGYKKYLACLLADFYKVVVPKPIHFMLYTLMKKIPLTLLKNSNYIRLSKQFLEFSYYERSKRFILSDALMTPNTYKDVYRNYMKYPFWEHPVVTSKLNYLAKKKISYVTKMCLADTKIYLPEHNLNYSDKASMAASVELRQPLVDDHRIVEFMFSLPPRFRINKTIQKFLFKKAMEGILPKEVIFRPKAPFTAPLRSWIKGPLKEMVRDLLTPNSLSERGLYKPSTVLKIIEENYKGSNDYSFLIWTILTIELWFRTFIDRNR